MVCPGIFWWFVLVVFTAIVIIVFRRVVGSVDFRVDHGNVAGVGGYWIGGFGPFRGGGGREAGGEGAGQGLLRGGGRGVRGGQARGGGVGDDGQVAVHCESNGRVPTWKEQLNNKYLWVI